jgi:hypothetical protein
MNLTDVYRIFHPTLAQYTFFSAAHGTFSRKDHILGHNKYKKIELTPCILSDHNAIKLELNNKSSSKSYANNWRLNNTLFNDQWVKSYANNWRLNNTLFNDQWVIGKK